VVMPSAQYGTQAVQYMQALASAWESIGLKVNLDVTNAATFTKSLDSGTSSPDVTFINVSDAQFDMGQPYAQMISPQSDVAAYDPSSLNATDALINQANAATTQAARASALAQAGTLICNSNSFDFLYVPTFVYGKQKNVEWEQRLDGQIYLNTLRFTN
jgi:ABC-type transport system substrate-binding protein